MDFTTIEATPSTSMASAVSVSTTPFSTAVTPTLTSITTTSSTPRPSLDDDPWDITVYILTAILGKEFVLFFCFA